ncbi:MAG: glycosyltransferase family 9 protein [Acidobacteriota bacterium]
MSGRLPDTFSPARIVVVRLSALGDVIRTLPVLPPLKARFPAATLHWVCEPLALPVVESQELIDGVVVLPRGSLSAALRHGRLVRAAREVRHTIRQLREKPFDLVIDAQGTYKSALVGLSTGAPVRVGFARGAAREFLWRAATHPVSLPVHAISRVDKALRLLGPLGAEPGAAAARLPEDREKARRAARLWEAAGPAPRVLLAPGASARQAYKRWPAQRFGNLAHRLLAAGATVKVAFGPGEEDLARTVCQAAGRVDLQLPATSLPLLAELLRAADLFIGNDSGPMHLAWLVGTRVVVLYGPTDPVVNAPWGDNHVLIDGLSPGTPRRRDAAIMRRIAVEEVEHAARAALGI